MLEQISPREEAVHYIEHFLKSFKAPHWSGFAVSAKVSPCFESLLIEIFTRSQPVVACPEAATRCGTLQPRPRSAAPMEAETYTLNRNQHPMLISTYTTCFCLVVPGSMLVGRKLAPLRGWDHGEGKECRRWP